MKSRDGKDRGFSIFRSAGEEAQMRDGDESEPTNEGGHMSCTGGRIVSTPAAGAPFLAVMTRGDGSTFEIAFTTMSDAEAFVRRNTPKPPTRSTTHDRPPD